MAQWRVLVAAFQERLPKLSFQPKSLWTEGTGDGVLAPLGSAEEPGAPRRGGLLVWGKNPRGQEIPILLESLHPTANACLHGETECALRAQTSARRVSDLFFVNVRMGSSQLHVLFFITVELTFCRLLSKEGANQELAGGGLEAENRTIPCPQTWQGPTAARRDLGEVKAKSIW